MEGPAPLYVVQENFCYIGMRCSTFDQMDFIVFGKELDAGSVNFR